LEGNGMIVHELLNKIETFFAENITDDEEKGYFDEYKKLKGATDDEINIFENEFNIKLPEDFKEYYKIKNGSEYPFNLLYITYENSCIPFTIMSIADIKDTKKYFCERDDLLENYYDKNEIKKLDDKIKPYLFNKKWFPFAQVVGGSLYLLLDFDPTEKGEIGQIIFYVHDPDFIYYITETFTELLKDTINNLKNYKNNGVRQHCT
jgi:cell wall assembly regulator SMI1